MCFTIPLKLKPHTITCRKGNGQCSLLIIYWTQSKEHLQLWNLFAFFNMFTSQGYQIEAQVLCRVFRYNLNYQSHFLKFITNIEFVNFSVTLHKSFSCYSYALWHWLGRQSRQRIRVFACNKYRQSCIGFLRDIIDRNTATYVLCFPTGRRELIYVYIISI